MIKRASAATINTSTIDCGAAASGTSSVSVPSAVASGDTLIINYTGCNGFDLSWTNFSSSFGSSTFGENGNNSESRSLTNYTGSSSVGTLLATLSRTSGTAKTINILQIGVTWTSK
ncbi:MAG: hypothetical protein ACO3T8_04810, partial [Candidatus Nanopelagicales bacterium]